MNLSSFVINLSDPLTLSEARSALLKAEQGGVDAMAAWARKYGPAAIDALEDASNAEDWDWGDE